jgi:predicted TIM-barrel fold metal-dependent hydrolase
MCNIRIKALVVLVLGCAIFMGCKEKVEAEKASPPYKRPMLIDAHTHLQYFAVERIKRIMDDNRIEVMINMSGGNHGDGGIVWAFEMQNALPGRIYNCYDPDWERIDEPDFAEVEAIRLEDAVKRFGFVCLKISKALGLYVRYKSGVLVEIDDPKLDPLWEAAGRLEIPVYQHAGDPKAFFLPPDEKNERFKELSVHPYWSFYGGDWPSWDALLDAFERVVARHPETIFIGVHFGNAAEEPERVARMLDKYPNYFIDIAARVPEFGRHDAKKMHDFFVKYQDRILFGTDIGISKRHLVLGSSGEENPTEEDAKKFYQAHFRYFETNDRQIDHPTPIQGDWKIDAIGLPPEVLDKIYRKNAERIVLKRKP